MSNLARSLCLSAALGFLALSPAIFGQQAAAQSAADDFFARSDWTKAAQAYSQLTAADPQNALAWQNLGESLLQLRKFPESIQAFHRAADLNFRPLVNRINIARAYAEQGDRDSAIKALKEIAASGQGGRARPFIAGSTEFARYK
ncbi:MAG: tetratricopeptide repeat protein, partial [Candidatus Acidiferrales bacterium]